MKLIKLQDRQDRIIFLNPDYIVYILPALEDDGTTWSHIRIANPEVGAVEFEVLETPEEIVKLMEE